MESWKRKLRMGMVGGGQGAFIGGVHRIAATLDQLQALPVGWADRQLDTPAQIATMALGLIITASSALFGAPFWFDLLQHLVQLRGTGAKPPKNGTAVLNHGNTLA